MRPDEELSVDYLVIGSGIAGLWFAWKAGKFGKVLIVTKKNSAESNTNYAQGGIAAAIAEDDSPRLHYEDTIRAGAGLAHPDIVEIVTSAGPRLVNELWRLGIEFSTKIDATGQKKFDLGREGGHRRRRIVHAQDATGQAIEKGLLAAVRSISTIHTLEEHFTVDLLLDQDGNCAGALILEKSTGRLKKIRANACLLATGGVGQVYRHTTNPAIATGDGIAIAYRAGALIANMEFIQFHPTALYGHKLNDRVFLISEAVRGEGAILKTRDGREFMSAYHPDGPLAPRDIVARAIAAEMLRRGDEFVLLDCTMIPRERLVERFPNIYETCMKLGIDIANTPIPVVPAAHYVCGGIAVNSWGESSIGRLFCAGECACTGLHGANRLASNSLLEALVFAERAAISATEKYPPVNKPKAPQLSYYLTPHPIEISDQAQFTLANRLRNIMWQYAGIIRSDAGLNTALRELNRLKDELPIVARCCNSVPLMEMQNMLIVAQLIVICSQIRKESRGLHYNQDHPFPDEKFELDTVISVNKFNVLEKF
ncbi:MAG: L-aspartate oxidase [candidate division WOR-3 bacterium]|uniref:L-aspartate oxidase n=1 Tax=candidate division WOR-3 bacterium TaxID=2052148 RepID=A0A7C1SCL3_UNCW3|nr:L-aspartate oxidase [candidate division WOR-3 bacterium]